MMGKAKAKNMVKKFLTWSLNSKVVSVLNI